MAQAFHWIIVVLVIGQFTLGFTAHPMPVSLLRLKLLTWHKSLGLTVFALAVLRLGWRLYSPPPALPQDISRAQHRLAQGGHALLYALLLTMPLVGWITSSASNLTVKWFFLVTLPNLVQPDPGLAAWTKDLHIAMSWLLLATVIGHVAAAFWHEWGRKDDVLRRMLPLPLRSAAKEKP
ncbi:MAG: cytochrome b [Bacillota bacterium]